MGRVFITGSTDGLGLAAARRQASTAYSESKLHVAALAFAVARLWPDTSSNAVDPGWVPTKMGGPSATDDLRWVIKPKCGSRERTTGRP